MAGPFKPLWGLDLRPSRGPQPRSPASLSALYQTRAPLLILALPAAACAKRCNLPPAWRSPWRRPAACWRFYVAIKNHLKGHFVSLGAACSTGGGRLRNLESGERTATGLPFKRPNQVLNPRNLFPLSMNPGACTWRLRAPGNSPHRMMKSGPFLTPSHL